MPEATRAKNPEIVGLSQISEGTIYPHVFGSPDREVGGVLVGRVPHDGNLPMITGAIPALGAAEQRATLTFTQDSWSHFHQRLDADYPEEDTIVGWYHSHPGFGIFLSEHDLFIHRNFFSGASQVAVVVDPLAGTEGAFAWRDGNVAPIFERPTPKRWPALGRGSQMPLAVAPPPPPPAPAPARQATGQSRGYPIVPLLLAAILGLAIGLAVATQLTSSEQDSSEQPIPAQDGVATVEPAGQSTIRVPAGDSTILGEKELECPAGERC